MEEITITEDETYPLGITLQQHLDNHTSIGWIVIKKYEHPAVGTCYDLGRPFVNPNA